MKTRTKVIIDWLLVFIFCVSIFFTLRVLPVVWDALEYFLGKNMEYIPATLISIVPLYILFYTVFIRKQPRVSSYVWFFVLSAVLFIIYGSVAYTWNKMNIFEYFIISFLFFKILHYHIFDTRLYILCTVFSALIAITEESAEFFTPGRLFEVSDIMISVSSAVLAQLFIALVVRPKLEKWRFRLKIRRRILRAQEKWLKRKKAQLRYK